VGRGRCGREDVVGQEGRCGGGLIEGGSVQRRNRNGHRELEVEMSSGEG
jgi:hypothetical protein